MIVFFDHNSLDILIQDGEIKTPPEPYQEFPQHFRQTLGARPVNFCLNRTSFLFINFVFFYLCYLNMYLCRKLHTTSKNVLKYKVKKLSICHNYYQIKLSKKLIYLIHTILN